MYSTIRCARHKVCAAAPVVTLVLILPSLVVAQALPFFPNVTPNDALEQRQEQQRGAAKQRAMGWSEVCGDFGLKMNIEEILRNIET